MRTVSTKMIHFSDVRVGQRFMATFSDLRTNEDCIRTTNVVTYDQKYNAVILTGNYAGAMVFIEPTEGVRLVF